MLLNLVQYNPEWENKKANKNKLISLIKNNPVKGSLYIFPEMTLTGFTMKSKDFAEDFKGESFEFFSNMASENKIHVVAGLIEQDKGIFYNTLVYLDTSGELVTSYRKIHPFSYSSEHKFYSGGNKTVIADINGWRTGLAICYDLRFPELFREYGKKKVELIIVIANWPDTRIRHWRTLLAARAIENQCYVTGVNRVGNDLKLHYNGYSAIFDPMGDEIESVPDKEIIISAEIGKENVEQVRNKFPFLNDITLI